MVSFLYFTAITFFLLLAVLLCGLIYIQEGKGGGLGAAFGGESQDSLFGTSTADILKKITGYLAAVFLVMSVLMSLWTSSMGRVQKISDESVIEELQE